LFKKYFGNSCRGLLLFGVIIATPQQSIYSQYSIDYALTGLAVEGLSSDNYTIIGGWSFFSSKALVPSSYFISSEVETYLILLTDLFLSSGMHLGHGWNHITWFGTYYGLNYPWVYHQNLGWTYFMEEEKEKAWLYKDHLGWVWTDSESFPYLYMDERNQWTFLDVNKVKTTLYDYKYAEWFELGKAYSIHAEAFPISGGTVLGTGDFYRWEKVQLQAKPNDHYVFGGWLEDNSSTSDNFEFEATQDVLVAAKFIPKINTLQTSAQLVESIVDFLNDRIDLTEEQKELAFAELISSGISKAANLSIVNQAQSSIDISVNHNASAQDQILEIKSQLDLIDVSEEQKNQALAEILIYGHSASLGILLQE
jgi:hypothetical protein